MIKERYCSYEVAKLLKEKGFDEECHHIYVGVTLEWTNTIYGEDAMSNNEIPYVDIDVITAPTHQMACDWLREEKGILIEIEHRNYDSGTFRWTVYSKRNTFPKWVGIESDISNSYGEAIEAALKYSLENLV